MEENKQLIDIVNRDWKLMSSKQKGSQLEIATDVL